MIRRRIARKLGDLLSGAVRQLPLPINHWLHEPSVWDARIHRWAENMLCKPLGHVWYAISEDQFMCDNCTMTWESHDPYAFDPASRDFRDAYEAVGRALGEDEVRAWELEAEGEACRSVTLVWSEGRNARKGIE